MTFKEERAWREALKVGDEVAFCDYSRAWSVACVVKIGKGKGQRFKVRIASGDIWLNDRGVASGPGGWSFRSIAPLTPEVRASIYRQQFVSAAVSTIYKLDNSKSKMRALPPDKLERISSLLTQALAVLEPGDTGDGGER